MILIAIYFRTGLVFVDDRRRSNIFQKNINDSRWYDQIFV